ncbi:FAD/NAD(P)-binding protein [Corynebacterium pygosceleis]|uniref:FAD/NAD(P)-binding protein n=1 Tax=Corynebacterium pygosceleis TaxID=2800406 RepID=UPI001905DA4D|nr:FAD/NAD(P)-binding protein [Corynebacterium pygosceleis]MCL0121389.1 FAD/NAD(P)-binding protein [Corynebacterium pygosceleis]
MTSPKPGTTQSIAIIGAGPRGTSVLERLGAALHEAPGQARLDVHLIDGAQHGSGEVWRTDQSGELCMNTLAGAVTMFTEPGSTVSAPVRRGPTLHEWVRLLRGENPDEAGIDPDVARVFRRNRPAPVVAVAFADELRTTRPESNPSRRLYGAYLRWFLDVTRRGLPPQVTLHHHRSRAVAITATTDGTDEITLADGAVVRAGATVLAPGWQLSVPDDADRLDASDELTWIRPGQPADQRLDLIVPGETVLLRGLGMGFFDAMILLTAGRGGRFVDDPAARSGLRYVPSGREPRIVAASGRGYPLFPKSEYRSLPPRMPHTRLRAVVRELSAGDAPIDVDRQVWPAVARDAHEAYHRALHRTHPDRGVDPADLVALIDDTPVADLPRVLAARVPGAPVFDPGAEADPLAARGITGPLSPEEFTAAVADGLAADITHAAAGRDSAWKEGMWSIASARRTVSVLGANGRYTPDSRRGRYAWMMALGRMAGSGPPAFRTRELLALVDAGVVSFLGAHPTVAVTDGGYRMHSPTTDRAVTGRVLLDARLPAPDVRTTADPLMRDLLQRGRIRVFRLSDGSTTPSPEVDPVTQRVITADGTPDPRLHLIGIPTHAQMPDTTISPMPGTDATLLRTTDAAAVHALAAVSGRV